MEFFVISFILISLFQEKVSITAASSNVKKPYYKGVFHPLNSLKSKYLAESSTGSPDLSGDTRREVILRIIFFEILSTTFREIYCGKLLPRQRIPIWGIRLIQLDSLQVL